MAQPWFRLYVKFATDPKIQTMSEQDQRRWIMLLCLRGSDSLTEIMQYGGEPELARVLNVSIGSLSETKAALLARNLITESWDITNWDEKQYVTDSSRDRVQRHRENRRSSCNGDVTLPDRYCNVTVTAPDTDTDTETENNSTTPPRARAYACEDNNAILIEESVPESPYDSADNLAYIERHIVKPLHKALESMFPEHDLRDTVARYWRKALAGECNRIRQRRLNHLTIFAQMQAWSKAGISPEDLRRHIQTHLDRIAAHDYPDHPEKYVTALIGYELKHGRQVAKKFTPPAAPGSIPEQTYDYPAPPAALLAEWRAGLETLRARFAARGGLLSPDERLAAIRALSPIGRNNQGVLRIGAHTRNEARNARDTYYDDLAAVFGPVVIEP